ncbi:hypothetical protein BUB20358_06090 [Burkholderia ubonensis]|nr:hypothetical protein BUB20358_06090 [Burkholderia ubonensis]
MNSVFAFICFLSSWFCSRIMSTVSCSDAFCTKIVVFRSARTSRSKITFSPEVRDSASKTIRTFASRNCSDTGVRMIDDAASLSSRSACCCRRFSSSSRCIRSAIALAGFSTSTRCTRSAACAYEPRFIIRSASCRIARCLRSCSIIAPILRARSLRGSSSVAMKTDRAAASNWLSRRSRSALSRSSSISASRSCIASIFTCALVGSSWRFGTCAQPPHASTAAAIASARFVVVRLAGVQRESNGVTGTTPVDGPLFPSRRAPRVREVFIYFPSTGMDTTCVWFSGR